MKRNSIIAIAVAALIGGGFTAAFAADEQKSPASAVPKDYPLTTCPVSGEKLGKHGKPVKVTSEGTDVWLCCKSCIKDFNKEPAKFVNTVKDAKATKK